MKKIIVLVLTVLFATACGVEDQVPPQQPTTPNVVKGPGFCQCDINWANGSELKGGVIFGDNSLESDRQLSIGIELLGDAPEKVDVWIRVWGFAKQATKAPSGVYWADFTIPEHHKSVMVEAYTIKSRCVGASFIYGLR